MKDKDVLLIEDIVDSGITLNYIRERILAKVTGKPQDMCLP